MVGNVTNKVNNTTIGSEKDQGQDSMVESVPLVGDVAKELKPETQQQNETETDKIKEGFENIPFVNQMVDTVTEEPLKDESTKKDGDGLEEASPLPIDDTDTSVKDQSQFSTLDKSDTTQDDEASPFSLNNDDSSVLETSGKSPVVLSETTPDEATPLAEELVKDSIPEKASSPDLDGLQGSSQASQRTSDSESASDTDEDLNSTPNFSENTQSSSVKLDLEKSLKTQLDSDSPEIDLQVPSVEDSSAKSLDMDSDTISPKSSPSLGQTEVDSEAKSVESVLSPKTAFGLESESGHSSAKSGDLSVSSELKSPKSFDSDESTATFDVSPLADTREEEYNAETEVAVHHPEHHSMKDDSMAKEIVRQHLKDSAETSQEVQSGITKIDLTDVKHDSKEVHQSFQTGNSNSGAGILGATAQSTALGNSVSAKTVNTDVTKIKFQQSPKTIRSTGAALVKGCWLALLLLLMI